MIEQVTNADALPVLERLMQFTARRHGLIANNIANLDTPGFQPRDVPLERFQQLLGEAVDTRRAQTGGSGRLVIEGSPDVEMTEHGMLLRPEALHENVMFHDENDRDHERIMQDMVENFTMFRTAAQLLRKQFDLINTAIRERVT